MWPTFCVPLNWKTFWLISALLFLFLREKTKAKTPNKNIWTKHRKSRNRYVIFQVMKYAIPEIPKRLKCSTISLFQTHAHSLVAFYCIYTQRSRTDRQSDHHLLVLQIGETTDFVDLKGIIPLVESLTFNNGRTGLLNNIKSNNLKSNLFLYSSITNLNWHLKQRHGVDTQLRQWLSVITFQSLNSHAWFTVEWF